MAKKKNNRMTVNSRECPRYEGCEVRLGIAATKGRIVSLIHLAARAFYTLVGWFVLGKGITSSFFVSTFLFVFPILMDCVYYGFLGWSRRWVILIETLVSVAWSVFSLLGLFGVIAIKENGIVTFADDFTVISGLSISVNDLWWWLGSILFITCVDFSSRLSIKEDSMQMQRKGV